MTDINANNIDIHETVEIGNNVRITCDTIKLGKFCKIGDNVTIDCTTFESDEWLFTSGYEVRLNIGFIVLSYGSAQDFNRWRKGKNPYNYLRMTLVNPF